MSTFRVYVNGKLEVEIEAVESIEEASEIAGVAFPGQTVRVEGV